MNIIIFLLIGLIAGFLAGKIMKSKLGFWGDLILGVCGAFLGGFLFPVFGLFKEGIISFLISALIGAIVILFLYKLFFKK